MGWRSLLSVASCPLSGLTPECWHNLMMIGLHLSVDTQFFSFSSTIWFLFPSQLMILLNSFAYYWSFFKVSYLLLKTLFWWLRHRIWISSCKRYLSFLLIIYSFIFLSFLDNTPTIFLAQILFSFPIILSASTEDPLKSLLAFMWAFFLLSNLYIIESYLRVWICQV